MGHLTLSSMLLECWCSLRATSWLTKGVGACVLLIVAILPLSWMKYQELTEIQSQLSEQKLIILQTRTMDIQYPKFQLLEFNARIPKETICNQLIERFLVIANTHAVEYNQVTYRLIPIANPKLSRLDIVMPLKGNFLNIRQFIVGTLNAFPSAAIANMQFERAIENKALVNAKLHLTVYFFQQ